jgi:hypothetical protein
LGPEAPAPRGGTSTGAPVTFAEEPIAAWQALQQADLRGRERDRRAILAMAGDYRVDFDFIETVALQPDYERARPYQSWATETVLVLEDTPQRIVLQHILAMSVVQEDGSIAGPMVVKHWRQDWTWEDREILRYRGDDTWELVRMSEQEASGRWSQAVWGVADEPRYEGLGRWHHEHGDSVWISDETWRTLPRREHTVRDDYDVLAGVNHHHITPAGWTHEQRNRKLVLDVVGEPSHVLAVELGCNRYRRITDLDTTAVQDYWQQSAPYWQAVRAAWDHAVETHGTIRVQKRIDDQSLVGSAFAHAEDPPADPAAAAEELVQRHVQPVR